jgi:4-hydroxy-tetrahydrodipicolinate reductase
MKIAIVGYGRMGREIEKIALERGHAIGWRISSGSVDKVDDVKNVDVAIEFTRPDAAFNNIKSLLLNGIPVISGTTGWNRQFHELKTIVEQANSTFLPSSNFSIGVNIFFEINKKLATIMNQFDDYDVSVDEIHHVKKLDAPSGTAVTIAEQIIENINRKYNWKLTEDNNTGSHHDLAVTSIRKGDVPGTHKVKYSSSIDDIEIIHQAHNRIGFAKGAVLAAEWIREKKGFLTMADFLKF